MYVGLVTIARQIMDHRERKYGIHSIEYVMAAAYYFDVVAFRKTLNFKKWKVEADLSQIKTCLEILAPEARQIFERYIDHYIGEDDGELELDDMTSEVLGQLWSNQAKAMSQYPMDFFKLVSGALGVPAD